jgi:large subunit ribosomal protein L22
MATAETRSEVRAEARYVRAAPRKAQLVVEQIRGRSVPEARTILAFMTRDAARDVAKVLNSAASNAEANHGLDADEMIVSAAFVGEGPTLKRWRARARGRVGRIRKRTCHITVSLALPTGAELPAPIERPAPVVQTEEPEPIVVDDATGEVISGEAPVEEAPAEEKPKRAPRKKKTEEAPETEAGAATVEVEAEEKPKPKRTRAAKPKVEPAAEAEGETAEKPKPRTRKKKTETETTETDEGSES